jgi:Skp family chaperone for outer membrane proteins
VGYVDVDRITRKAKPVNLAMDGIQGELETLQKQVEEKRRQIRDLEADIKRTDGVVSKDEQDKKKKELLRLQNEMDDLRIRGERKAREMDQTVFEPLMKKILFAIQDIAKEQKFDIILRGEAVLYGTSGVDISDEVVSRLNSEKTAVRPAETKEGTPDAKAPDSPDETAKAEQPKDEGKAPSKPAKTPEPGNNADSGKAPQRAVDRQPE